MAKLTYRQRSVLCNIGGFLLTTGGGFAAGLSLFYLPITADLGFSRASLAGYLSLMSWAGVVTHPFMGRIFARFSRHIRLIGLIGAAYSLLCFFLLSRSTSLIHFYIAGAMMSLLLPFCGSMLGSTVVSWWFTKGRSVAIALVAVGSSIGTMIYSKIAGAAITSYGWRNSYLILGVFLMCIMILGAIMISPPPEYYGMKPEAEDGLPEKAAAEPADASSGKNAPEAEKEAIISLKTLVRIPAFRLLCLAAVTGCSYTMIIMQSIVPMLEVDFGMIATSAATILSAYSILGACFKPVTGAVFRKFSPKTAVLYTGGLLVLAGLLLYFTRSLSIAIAAFLMLGPGNMFGMVLLPAIVSETFGAKRYPVVVGYVNVFFTLGAGIGPVIAGAIYDITGSYRVAFLLVAILSAATIVLALSALRSRNTAETTA